ncbi:MAG: thioredoxin family protein [Promethearchaeota archaeon]
MTDDEKSSRTSFEDMARRLEIAMTQADEPLANGVLNELVGSNYMDNLKQPRTAIIEFYTTSCPFCHQLAPLLEELAGEYTQKVYFGKVNIDLIEEAAERFNVAGVPSVIAFKKGNPVARIEGLRGIDEIDDWVDSIHKGLRPMNFEPGPITDFKL